VKRDAGRKGSERSLALRRSKSGESRTNAQEDPRTYTGGQARRVPSRVRGVRHFGDKPQDPVSVLLVPSPDDPATLVSAPDVGAEAVAPVEGPAPELSHYKGVSLKNVGRDARGRVIPHKRTIAVAKQIAIWIAGGADLNAIAIRLNVRPGLLKREYPKEIALGTENVHMDVHTHILARVKKSDRVAIFYAKAKMGYRDGDSKPLEGGVFNLHIHT
jgi:hypothetical protein